MRRLAPRRVVITCTTGRTIVGTLALSWPWGPVRVRNAKLAEAHVDPNTSPTVDGIVRVRRGAIDFMQVI
jgi:hypothetical protein